MSLEETAKLLSESRKIVDQGKESNDVTYLLNLILNVVTNVDNGVQKIENKLSKLDEVQAEVNVISLRLGPLEPALTETQIKYVEIENSVKGLSNIFDGVKESVEMQAKKIEPIKKECLENESEIKKN
jgi:conjugal transfer/entry exclusion protein